MQKIKEYIKKLEEGCDLSSEEAEAALEEVLSTAEDGGEIETFLLALKAKGEKPQEIVGFVRGMKKAGNMIKPNTPPFRIVDTCGTGGGTGSTPSMYQLQLQS